MKKLLVILIAVAGVNAYAGSLALYNETTNQLSVECMPSQTICNKY